jgi:hypothetical protein
VEPEKNDPEQILTDKLLSFRFDPLGFVNYAYPWGEAGGGLDNDSGDREWQVQLLSGIKAHLENPATRYTPYCEAVSSGHGIGKSALVGQVIDWAMSSWRNCRVKVTANTGDQLTTKTAPETAKWIRLSINAHWWKVGAESIRVKDPTHEKTWRCDFETWSLERTEAFAGLHNKGSIIVIIFDEAAAIPDKIWEVTEGVLTDEDTVIIWLAFGNPTKNTGRFRECFGKLKHRWKNRQIDSRTVEGTNKSQIQKWIDDYGEDSDFVRVRVRGEFPRAGSNQFIASDTVAACRKYKAEGFAHLPKILSVDVARFGDDQSIIGLRHGRKLDVLGKFRGLDTVQLAGKVIEAIQEHEPDATVIDGDGVGAGVVDTVRDRGFHRKTHLHEFHGGAVPEDTKQYFNRRAEIWGLLRDALKEGMQIPDDPEMETDLTGIQYGFSSKQQIQLERKEDLKKRGLSSPDLGDMAAMTFAVKVVKHKEPAPERINNYGESGWMA